MEGVQLDHLAQYLGEVADAWEPPVWLRPGAEQAIQLGGSGTPLVPEFAVCEIAAALGLTQPAATLLCADVLDLAYRLRRVAVSVRSGVLSMGRARVIARRTRDLTAAQAELVQERLLRPRQSGRGPEPMAALVPMSRLRTVIDQAVATVRGPDSEAEAQRRVAESLYVQVTHEAPGATDLAARLTTADAARLDRRLNEVAGWLTQVGDTRPKPVLRAVALALLADPALLQALSDLRTHQPPHPDPTQPAPLWTADPDTVMAGADRPGQDPPMSAASAGAAAAVATARAPAAPASIAPTAAASNPAPPTAVGQDQGAAGIAGLPTGVLEKFAKLTSTVLYVHLDRGSGTWCEENAGVLTKEQARQIVGHANVTVRPVLDLAEELTYTGYVAPPRLKEQLALLNAGYCTFPHCHRRARAGDVDHQLPAASNGATRSSNTHRLCRKHHRAKDQGRWRVVEPAPGLWIWASPAGAIYLVSNGITRTLNGIFTARGLDASSPACADDTRTRTPADQSSTANRDRSSTARDDRSSTDPPAAPDGDIRTGVKNWSPSWDPWHDTDPLTESEHEYTYGLINTG